MSDSSFLPAFIGAASAFLFMRLVTWLDKIYERDLKHFYAILEVSHACSESTGQIQQIQVALKAFQAARARSENNQIVPLIINRPASLTFPVPNKAFLVNKDFLNCVYRQEKLIETIDMDIKNFTTIHHQGQLATLANQDLMPQQRFITNICCDMFDKLEPALEDLFQRNIQLIAQSHVLLKHHRPIALRIMKFLNPKRLPSNYKDEVASEINHVKKEFSESLEKDALRIKKTLKTRT